MKIYLVHRTDEIGYDEYIAWVIIAKSPKEAISLCNWADGSPERKDVQVREVKAGKNSRRLLGSFNAG